MSKEIEKIILEFIKNRSQQNETTASRHIHRRFDISMENADEILTKLSTQNAIGEVYDEEYQENRYVWKGYSKDAKPPSKNSGR